MDIPGKHGVYCGLMGRWNHQNAVHLKGFGIGLSGDKGFSFLGLNLWLIYGGFRRWISPAPQERKRANALIINFISVGFNDIIGIIEVQYRLV